jgi:hypothetical protein
MRVGLAALLLAACAAKPPAPLDVGNAAAPATGSRPVRDWPPVSATRPELDIEQLIPDFHDVLRWPLSAMAHPTLEPRFAIAAVFADPGVGWLELCQRGVQNRIMAGQGRDELDYLRGWCNAVKGDADGACDKLAPLVSSTVMGMSTAVRVDVANIIANQGGIDKADHLLKKHNIRDLALLDILAATYVEVGDLNDAFEINRRATDQDLTPVPATKCRRLVRDIVLRGRGGHEIRAKELADMTKGKAPDPTCVELHHEMLCWLRARDCDDYFQDIGVDVRTSYLIDAYQSWPHDPVSSTRWLDIATDAVRAMPLEGAREMAVSAFDAAIRASSSCDNTVLANLMLNNDVVKEQRFTDELVRCGKLATKP